MTSDEFKKLEDEENEKFWAAIDSLSLIYKYDKKIANDLEFEIEHKTKDWNLFRFEMAMQCLWTKTYNAEFSTLVGGALEQFHPSRQVSFPM